MLRLYVVLLSGKILNIIYRDNSSYNQTALIFPNHDKKLLGQTIQSTTHLDPSLSAYAQLKGA